MTYRYILAVLCLFGSALFAASCGSDEEKNTGDCSVGEQSGCEEGLVCQEVSGGEPACFCSTEQQTGCDGDLACEAIQSGNSGCFPPIVVEGRVFDLATDEGIEGALVVARDANNAAVSGIAETGINGEYELPVPATRDENGNPVETQVTLRADADGYLTFPLPPRIAVPFDVSMARVGDGGVSVVRSAATDVGLIALEQSAGLGTIKGTVIADAPRGTLVVAGGSSGSGGATTGVADGDGSYTVFNVAAGTVEVQGFKQGLQLNPATADVVADQVTEGVDLEATGEATAVVSGKIEIVNPGDGSDTSVIFVVDETFDPNAARGEAPPGLRVGNITGAWSIDGVPDGNYVVLAAFENDFLVRDPDVSIGGTEIVRITVSGGNVEIAEGFKVTGALDVVSPDDEEQVGPTPNFVWRDDSGEDHYEIRVFDAFGNEVWSDLNIPSVMGSQNVTVPYAGPALESGLLYQFRATSIKQGGAPISTTEDLRGVFVVQ